jgi:hypothetical protein
MQKKEPIGIPLRAFCQQEGLGSTTVRTMIADRRIKAFRVGRRKLMINVESYRVFVEKQLNEGMAPYTTTEAAVAARMANRAEEKRAGVKPVAKPRGPVVVNLAKLGLA